MNVQPITFQLLGYVVQLARPDRWPLVLLAFLCVGLLGFAIASRRRRLASLTDRPRLLGKIVRGAGGSRELFRGICTASGLMLFALAALQPQSGQRETEIQSRGIDLVVAIDASRSMLGRDVLPSRLERARLELSRLIDGLKGDRVGIVVFAGQAFVQCPLTSDYGAARLFLRAIDPESMPSQGTAIAEALTTAATMLENADRGASTRVVLLLSDGEDHRGDVEAAARTLAEKGVKVFSLGIGTAAGTPVPVLDKQGNVTSYLQDDRRQTVVTRLEEGQLRQIAEITGGRYVAGLGGDIGMGEVFAELENLEKSEFDSKRAVQYADIWHWLGFPGFVFLLLGACVGDRWRKGAVAGICLAFCIPSAAQASPFEKSIPAVVEGLDAWKKEDFEGALKSFDAAVAAHPEIPSLHFNRGNALHRLGRFEEAKEAFHEALARREDERGAARDYTNLGNVYAAMGEDEHAMASFRRALAIDPEATVARHNLEVLLRRKQQDEQQQDEQQQDEQQQDEQQQDEQQQDEQQQDEQQNEQQQNEQQQGEQQQGEQNQDEQQQNEQQQDEQQQNEQQQNEQNQNEQQQNEQNQNEQQQDEQNQNEQQQNEQQQNEQQQNEQQQNEQQQAERQDEPQNEPSTPPGAGAVDETEELPAPTRSEAERLLDSLREGEKNFQLWRYQNKKGTTHDPRDW